MRNYTLFCVISFIIQVIWLNYLFFLLINEAKKQFSNRKPSKILPILIIIN